MEMAYRVIKKFPTQMRMLIYQCGSKPEVPNFLNSSAVKNERCDPHTMLHSNRIVFIYNMLR